VGLATASVRGRLVGRLGQHGFLAVFWAIAALSFTALVVFYAAHRLEGASGPDLGRDPGLRGVLMAVIVLGVVLGAYGLADYPRLPTALFAQTVRGPRGVERITRHPFFVGTALFAGAHVLLATRLVGTVFFAGFALLAVLGARHQDRKLLAARGEAYARYLAVTSTVPFAAILSGRQAAAWGEISVVVAAVGLGVAFVLRVVHDSLFAHGGTWIVVALLAGALQATVQRLRRARRAGARVPGETVA
jgi:uncharacterized membrane protein